MRGDLNSPPVISIVVIKNAVKAQLIPIENGYIVLLK